MNFNSIIKKKLKKYFITYLHTFSNLVLTLYFEMSITRAR
jgi:hypothetical protein